MNQVKHGNLWEYTKTPEGIQCPVCLNMVDYLVGEDTPDGGVMGCEGCYKLPTGKQQVTNAPEKETMPA